MTQKIIFTEQQEDCINTVCALYKTDKPVITIAGFAGSGKSTVIKEIINRLNIPENEVLFCTLTGKASQVLAKKGIPATTIHQTIYHSYKDKEGQWHFKLMNELENPFARLFVIDEISMVGENLLKDILSFGLPVIGLGDPAQLEPVLDNQTNLLNEPDYLLTQIHRQAEDNDIIKYSMQVRQDGLLYPPAGGSNIKRINPQDLDVSMLAWADIVLCNKNTTKQHFNKIIREYYGHNSHYPEVGDKVICTSNRWNVLSNNGLPLMNGSIYYITRIYNEHYDSFNPYYDAEIRSEYDPSIVYEVRFDLNNFDGKAEYKNKYYGRAIPRCVFDYGYCITVHKSQGSEYPKVLYYMNDLWGDFNTKKKLVYTAVTRASDKLVIIC